MKNILLDRKEKLILSELINKRCGRLFYDSVSIVLNLHSKFVWIGPKYEEAETQNEFGEAISIGIDKISSFKKYERQMKLFLENIRIDDVNEYIKR